MTKAVLQKLQRSIEDKLQNTPGVYSLELRLPNSEYSIGCNLRKLPSASLIKVFIMAEAFRQAASGQIDLSGSAIVTADVRVGGAGPLEFADFGTVVQLKTLIELMIVESDNTATNILINILGKDSINTFVANLNCHDTFLGRNMMDFAARAAGLDNYTSPADMNVLLQRIYGRQCLDPASDQAMLDILLGQADKCKFPLLLPNNTLIAHKTGELDGTEHDSGIFLTNPPYILTVMSTDLPDEAQGRNTIAELSRMVYDALVRGSTE